MSFFRCQLLLILSFLLIGVCTVSAAEPKLAFDLKPNPQFSATDIEDSSWSPVGGGFIANIRPAIQGNVFAMIQLAVHTEYYGDITRKKYPRIPKRMHEPAFWDAWAERFTSKGWVLVQKGHAEKALWRNNLYRAAARAGNAEGMHLASEIITASEKDRKKGFWGAIDRNYGPALVALGRAYLLGGVVERSVMPKDPQKGREYLKQAASLGMFDGFISEAWDYMAGEFGRPKDPATAYVYYLLAKHYAIDRADIWYLRTFCKDVADIPEVISPEARDLAYKTAVDWVAEYNAIYKRTLEEARVRRKPVLEEFRKELAPVIEWLSEQDAAEDNNHTQ